MPTESHERGCEAIIFGLGRSTSLLLKKLIEQFRTRMCKEALRILFAFAKEKVMTSVAQNRGWTLCIVFFLALGILQARALYASNTVREVRIRAPQSESDVAHSYSRELTALALKKQPPSMDLQK